MKRMEAVMAWLSTCLGITLLAASVLVVPGTAFADYGSVCASGCQTSCGSDQLCFDECITKCCMTDCGTDANCGLACCQSACVNGDINCLSYCYQGQNITCSGNEICSNGCVQRYDNGNFTCTPAKTGCNKGSVNDCGACLCVPVGPACYCRPKS